MSIEDAAWRAFAVSTASPSSAPALSAEHARAIASSGALASLAADAAVSATTRRLRSSIDAAAGSIRDAAVAASRASTLAASVSPPPSSAFETEVDIERLEARALEADERAKRAAESAAAALSSLAEETSRSRRALRARLAPLVDACLSSVSASSSSAAALLSLRSAPARALDQVSADFAAALRRREKDEGGSAKDEGGSAGEGSPPSSRPPPLLLEAALTRFYSDRLRELSSRAGFDDDEDGDVGFQGDDDDDQENDASLMERDESGDGAPRRRDAPDRRATTVAPRRVDAASLMGARWVSEVASASSAARSLGRGPDADAAAAAAASAALAERAASAVASRGFDRQALPQVREWAARVPPALLEAAFGGGSGKGGKGKSKGEREKSSNSSLWLERWRSLLDRRAHDAVGSARSSQLFDAVVDWPASSPAIDDLRHALFFDAPSTTSPSARSSDGALRSRVAEEFGDATRRRLLHAGAATADVIAQYVSTVRCLRRLSRPPASGRATAGPVARRPHPSLAADAARLEERVTAPVRSYLRRRGDAVRCVVGALAGGGDGESANPLSSLLDGGDGDDDEDASDSPSRLAHFSAEHGGTGGASDADDDPDEAGRVAAALEEWRPPPCFSRVVGRRRRRRGDDGAPLSSPAPASSSSAGGAGGAVSLLASAFGGPDVLIDAFRSHAARALLSSRGGGGGAESDGRRQRDDEQPLLVGLELLRARFGDRASLVPAEVMLKDVADSRRLAAALRSSVEAAAGAAKTEREGPTTRDPAAALRSASTAALRSASASGVPPHLRDADTRRALRRFSALVTSSAFWPRGALPNEAYLSPTTTTGERQQQPSSSLASTDPPPFELPRSLRVALDAYGAHFSALKAPRKLVWRPWTAGVVTLEVEVAAEGGGEKTKRRATFSATPLEAAVLLRFSSDDGGDEDKRPQWRASELASALRVRAGAPAVERAAARWVSAGLLLVARERDATTSTTGDPLYRRASSLPSKSGRGGSEGVGAQGAAGASGGAGGAGPAGDDDDEEERDAAADDPSLSPVLEAFVIGMLTNFEQGLPTERIHSMLKMFATDPAYDAPASATAALLARMSREDKVVADGGGVWRKATPR